MSTDQELKVCRLLGYKLKQTQHLLRLHMDEALKSLGLTTPQYAVLAQLELRPGISNAELARLSFITAQTMHGIVANLEKRGLLSRKNDPEHGRILSAELTNKGKETVVEAHKIILKVESRMLSSITTKNRDLLEKLLNECFENLNNRPLA